MVGLVMPSLGEPKVSTRGRARLPPCACVGWPCRTGEKLREREVVRVYAKRKRKSWWSWLFFGGSSKSARQEKILEYMIHRINSGARLEDVVREPYVYRNCSEDEVDELLSGPRLVYAARERLELAFKSGELSPKRRDLPSNSTPSRG